MKTCFFGSLYREVCITMKLIMYGMLIPLLLFTSSESSLQCKNANNEVVDWFVAYKLPMNKRSSDAFIQKGEGFLYIAGDAPERGWHLAEKSINASDMLIAYTLDPLYAKEKNNDLLWILYNDETPNKTVSFTLGHTKGVVVANSKEGIWLVHSVPRFPPLPSLHFSYPKSGVHYGQSFMCISLTSSQVDNIGTQLQYNKPQIYSSNIPSNMKILYPNLVNAVAYSWIKSAPWNHMQQLTTSGGLSFQSFAKSDKFNKDLYADWVAPTLNVDLLVETWPNGQGRLPSTCQTPFKVYNVQSIALKKYDVSFIDHVDHSKWSISTNSSRPWVCVGDINRMESQEHRGGGTVCIQHKTLWTSYKQAVDGIEQCPRGNLNI